MQHTLARSIRHVLVLSGAGALIPGLALLCASAQPIQWGLTLTNINNSTSTTVATNAGGTLSISTGGGDTYGAPDSFAYAYQQVTGDFDICAHVVNVTTPHDTSVSGYDSPKGSLMVRATLDATSYDFMINALPVTAPRYGQIESIARLDLTTDTDDLPGKGQMYTGDTTDDGYCTYPDVWLRIQRQGNKFMTYFASDNGTNDYPSGANPGATNGWQLLTVAHPAVFSNTVYIGLSTVAHGLNNADTVQIVTSTYGYYGPTPNPHSTPSVGGVPAAATNAPGPFPNRKVLAVNFDASVSADGLGYPPDIVQSSQGAPQPITWNGDGFGGVNRDIIAEVSGESWDSFCAARYQAGAFDFMISPQNATNALQNLGPYSNPWRERFTSGDPTVPASEAWAPSPNYGFAMATVRKNGQFWNDQSPYFYAAAYVQLDQIGTGEGYDMIGGHFRGGQFYTRTTKLVTGQVSANGPSSGSLQRCAVNLGLAWFPYDQGWNAAYFDGSAFDPVAGTPHFKRGDGWAYYSPGAIQGLPTGSHENEYGSPAGLLTWVSDTLGNYSGLAMVELTNVNSVTDGMLFTVGNDENNSVRGPSANNAAIPDGSGWYVAVRDIETSKPDPTIYATTGGSDAGSSFSYLFIPWNADNLVGGHVRGTNGTVIKGAGNFKMQRLSTGVYALTIPGKADTNGVLLLENSGYLANRPTNVVDNCFMSYEYGGTNAPANAFIIQARYVDDSGGGEGVVTLRDADFNFVWVDFDNPLAPPGTTPPLLAIARSGSNVVVSWTNGPGFILQSASSLLGPAGSWTNLGTQNPQTVPLGAAPAFFRVVSP